jgi:hypothetical protein
LSAYSISGSLFLPPSFLSFTIALVIQDLGFEVGARNDKNRNPLWMNQDMGDLGSDVFLHMLQQQQQQKEEPEEPTSRVLSA